MKRHIGKLDVGGNPNPGLFCIANEETALGNNLKASEKSTLEETLGLKVKDVDIAGTNLLGIFAAMNSRGIAVPYIIEKEELKIIKRLGLKVFVSPSKETALGNMILVNDSGCLVSNNLKKHIKELEECFEVPVKAGTVGKVDIVGACGIATNKGCIVSINATDKEIKFIEELLKVQVGIGTVNTGSPYVKSGAVANSKGFVVSTTTTGSEIHRIDESLGFI